MAKKATSHKVDKVAAVSQNPQSVTIAYDLFDLPTAQHKAGLAGLLLQIDSMNNRKKRAPSYEWDQQHPSTKVRVTFTPETVKSLFDDLYDATLAPGPVREKPFTRGKGANKKEIPPLSRAPITKTDKKGNEKTVDGYIYMELAPSLTTLNHYLPQVGEWVKLWRDLIWQIIREGKKKAPYIKRASGKLELAEAASAEAEETDTNEQLEDDTETSRGDGSTWDDIVRFGSKGHEAIGKLSGALLLGAMEKNAEILTLCGRIDQNLLLHFWPLAVLVFIPRFLDGDGETHIGRRNKKDSAPHYCITVPEVSDLKDYVETFPFLLQQLSTETAAFRPRESLIDIPAEGAFSFLYHLASLTQGRVADSQIRYCVRSIEYFHLTKEGNNVKFVTTGRIVPRPQLSEDYQLIVGKPGEKPPYANPLFRCGLMLALLNDVPWFQPFGKLFADWPHQFFVHSDKSPPRLSWFWADARRKFSQESQRMPKLPDDPPPDPDLLLMTLVHRLVRGYVNDRAQRKSGINLDKFKDGDKINWDALPNEFSEARRAVGESLFLEFRSRRDQSFVSHFSQTLFSAKQFLSEDQFTAIGHALLNRTDDVKTLTLMSLSANS